MKLKINQRAVGKRIYPICINVNKQEYEKVRVWADNKKQTVSNYVRQKLFNYSNTPKQRLFGFRLENIPQKIIS